MKIFRTLQMLNLSKGCVDGKVKVRNISYTTGKYLGSAVSRLT